MSDIMMIFAENPGTYVTENHKGELVQTGPGLVVFRRSRSSNPQAWLDFKDFEPAPNGCQLVQGGNLLLSELLLVGPDATGRTWRAFVDQSSDRNCAWNRETVPTVRFSREVTAKLLKGMPFAQAIEQFLEAEREAELQALREKAALADDYETTLREVLEVNERGGSGSRAKVRAIITAVLPNISKVA